MPESVWPRNVYVRWPTGFQCLVRAEAGATVEDLVAQVRETYGPWAITSLRAGPTQAAWPLTAALRDLPVPTLWEGVLHVMMPRGPWPPLTQDTQGPRRSLLRHLAAASRGEPDWWSTHDWEGRAMGPDP